MTRKAEPGRRVRERRECSTSAICSSAARGNSPAPSSGVVLGRALVRDPKAFLMDSPLSDLDAKLRVQMRAELEEASGARPSR
jgi:multiple sugar transport system ATP-binding protein